MNESYAIAYRPDKKSKGSMPGTEEKLIYKDTAGVYEFFHFQNGQIRVYSGEQGFLDAMQQEEIKNNNPVAVDLSDLLEGMFGSDFLVSVSFDTSEVTTMFYPTFALARQKENSSLGEKPIYDLEKEEIINKSCVPLHGFVKGYTLIGNDAILIDLKPNIIRGTMLYFSSSENMNE